MGAGAAELGGGAGAGAELGGANVGAGDEPDPLDEPDPPDEPDPLDELDEPLDELDEPAAAWPACTVGWAPPGEVAPTILWRRLFAEWEWAREGPGVRHDVYGFALGASVAWLAVWAGAVRANKVAKPTAVTALSWVARQVRRERRRSPTARASPGCSSIVVDSIMVGESRYGSPVLWV